VRGVVQREQWPENRKVMLSFVAESEKEVCITRKARR
jgi:hypothetical protein